jgi:hypothetical protein
LLRITPTLCQVYWHAQLSAGGSYDVSRLKGAAIEATIVGQRLDKTTEVFLGDARQIMRWAVPILTLVGNQCNWYAFGSIAFHCARIASVMGEDYAPFLDGSSLTC